MFDVVFQPTYLTYIIVILLLLLLLLFDYLTFAAGIRRGRNWASGRPLPWTSLNASSLRCTWIHPVDTDRGSEVLTRSIFSRVRVGSRGGGLHSVDPAYSAIVGTRRFCTPQNLSGLTVAIFHRITGVPDFSRVANNYYSSSSITLAAVAANITTTLKLPFYYEVGLGAK